MKLKILISLFLLTSSFSCFAMESSSKETKETFPWERLPIDIKREILSWSWENVDKHDVQKMAEVLIRSIKQYNAISKVNKDFYNYITESFNRFLDNLTEEDFKKLNRYISDSLNKYGLPKDFNLLIRLLKKLNKLDPAIKKEIDSSLIKHTV